MTGKIFFAIIYGITGIDFFTALPDDIEQQVE